MPNNNINKLNTSFEALSQLIEPAGMDSYYFADTYFSNSKSERKSREFRCTKPDEKFRPRTDNGPGGITYAKKIGVNEPCPCGSGKKYKHCCLKESI